MFMPEAIDSHSAEIRFRVEDLLTPAAFPHAVTHLELRQTHISWVVLTGPFAYKIKKPVRYDFIDASTLQLRHALCEEELRLNLRFAPDLYLDVVPVTNDDGQLQIGGRGVPVEYAVRMHEFEPSQELANQLGQGGVTPHDINTFAAYLADLHTRAAVAPPETPYGTYESVQAQMLDNFHLLRAHLKDVQALEELEGLIQWTQNSLARLRPSINSRKHLRFVRECHGDLHARNIVRWRQQWLPFDCLEFDPQLRWIDVMSDVAFLFMDLIAHGRENLAYEFLSRYVEETGDYEGLRLLPLYAAYRALVRAKVDALGAQAAGPVERQALEARLTNRLQIAMRFMNMGPPALIVMHGVTACGKSWLSEQLISTIRAVRIRSDLERKRPASMRSPKRKFSGVGAGPYTPAAIEQTYARLLECAESVLEASCNVIVDATFLKFAHRQMFRDLALRHDCPFLIVSCRANRATLAARLKTRAQIGQDPSEATQSVLEEQLRTQEPLAAEEQPHALEIDTSGLTSADAGAEKIKVWLARFPHAADN
jgi:hypothetical protein